MLFLFFFSFYIFLSFVGAKVQKIFIQEYFHWINVDL